MKESTMKAKRYLFALIAFVATVTLLTQGIGVTLAGAAVAGVVLYGDRLLPLLKRRPVRAPRLTARPLSAERESYQLVPDEPSLVLSPEM
jgi:hypothetical protein